MINLSINLSNRPLTQHEVSILSKYLCFVPFKKADSFQTRVDVFKFLRSVKLRAFFDPFLHTLSGSVSHEGVGSFCMRG